MCQMLVDSFLEQCLLDTGSGLTILNPARGCTDETDPRWKTLERIGRHRVVIRGGPQGRMEAEMLVKFKLKHPMSGEEACTRGVILKQHVECFPVILLGRDTLFKDLEGIHLKWMTKTNELQVTFGQWKKPIVIQLGLPTTTDETMTSENIACIQVTEMVDKEKENLLID